MAIDDITIQHYLIIYRGKSASAKEIIQGIP